MRTGHIRTEGPLDEREKPEWDKRLQRRYDGQLEVSGTARRHKAAKSERMREIHLREWIAEQFIFDLINDHMPERHKAKLVNRSWHSEA